MKQQRRSPLIKKNVCFYGSLILIVSVCTGVACARFDERGEITIESAKVFVEIADDYKEKAQGLQYRQELREGTGMLFVYAGEQQLSFWMKNTTIPLDIAYIDAQGIIKEIHSLVPESLTPVTSHVPVQYALEVPRGWFRAKGISVGAVVHGLPHHKE